MATFNGGDGPSCVLVEGPGGEDIASPIFGVKDAPILALADTLAAARVSHAVSSTTTQLCTHSRARAVLLLLV